jgi:hypothetical protein
VNKIFSEFGEDLKEKNKTAFLKPRYKMNIWDFKSNPKDKIKSLYATFLSAASLENLSCTKFGTNERVEMHHVRLLSALNPKMSAIDKLMAKRRRKQIPLCRLCHLEHHKNLKSWKRK